MRNKNVNFKRFHQQKLDFDFSFKEIQNLAIKKWGQDIGGKTPSFFPNKNDSIFIFKGSGKSHPHFSDCINTLKENGLFLPNVTGLVFLEILDSVFDFLEPDSWILSFDELHNLKCEKQFGHFVPCLVKGKEGEYNYTWFTRNGSLEHDEYVLSYKKNED